MMAVQLFSKTKHHLFLTLAVVTGLFILILGGLVYWRLFLPFANANGKLINETNRIHYTPYQSLHQLYTKGICFDNCPVLTSTYNISNTSLGELRVKVADLLKSKGYTFEQPAVGDTTLIATRNHDIYQLNVGFGGDPFSTTPFNGSNDDNSPINDLVFIIKYNP